MRTTVTLEPDVSRRLRELSRSRKLSFKEALNAALRHGLEHMLARPKAKPFHTTPEDMGVLAHLNYDNIGDLLELTENTPRK
ncbi:MAG TPA: antitoxin [Verrucomicrobiota bacterium]|nr:antitoxin [Verrucomicrobiota bacterium]HNU49982.1 antitoxin [Verrucomicrobiota bacterium]